jgi:NADPH:quinone reductase-like Zn-dependent oxidoreductase
VQAAVRALVGGNGKIDVVCNPVGGSSWKRDYELLAPGGRLICYGVSTIAPGERRSIWSLLKFVFGLAWWTPIGLMNDNKTVSGVNMGHLFDHVEILRPQFESLIRMYEAGQIHPFVDKSFSFNDAPAAHQYLHDRKARGKLLLVP